MALAYKFILRLIFKVCATTMIIHFFVVADLKLAMGFRKIARNLARGRGLEVKTVQFLGLSLSTVSLEIPENMKLRPLTLEKLCFTQ